MVYLTPALVVGLACYFTVGVIRALPPFRGWVARGTKPWACDLCMSWWTSIAWCLALWAAGYEVIGPATWAASGGVSLGLLACLNREPPPLPQDFAFEKGNPGPENEPKNSRPAPPVPHQ